MGIPQILSKLFKEPNRENYHFPNSFIYNEEWMTKLILATHFDGDPCLPFHITENSTWFSEAQLLSPFLKRKHLKKDTLSEKQTHSDGVIGQIRIRSGTKSGLALKANVKQFIILEYIVSCLLRRYKGHNHLLQRFQLTPNTGQRSPPSLPK